MQQQLQLNGRLEQRVRQLDDSLLQMKHNTEKLDMHGATGHGTDQVINRPLLRATAAAAQQQWQRRPRT